MKVTLLLLLGKSVFSSNFVKITTEEQLVYQFTAQPNKLILF